MKLWKLLLPLLMIAIGGDCGIAASAAEDLPSTTHNASSSIVPSANLLEGHAGYAAEAAEVSDYIQKTYYLPRLGLYAHSPHDRRPAYMWTDGILFPSLLGAARHQPAVYLPIVDRFFKALDGFWDFKMKIPGYEPAPTRGIGHNKYYDDNAWMVLTFTEAYAMTHDRAYLDRARRTLDFVLSGWDDAAGGGIWWQEAHKDGSKNTCANAPAAVGCLRVAQFLPPDQAKPLIERARQIVTWTDRTLRLSDELYADNIVVANGKRDTDRLTYNTGLMIRAHLGLYRATGDKRDLQMAIASARASDWFLDKKTGAYRDSVKWAHLLVEADLEMWRATGDEHLLRRAINNADFEYKSWKHHHPDDLIDEASIARTLWLMADMQSKSGRAFWQEMDRRAGSTIQSAGSSAIFWMSPFLVGAQG